MIQNHNLKTGSAIAFVFSAAMGVTMGVIIVVQVELEERKKTASAIPTNGPKPEHIRNPRRKIKTYKDFNDIVDKY